MEPDGEIQFTPESALPDIPRILTITVDPEDPDNPIVDGTEFAAWEVKGLLRDALDQLRNFEDRAEADEDED